MTQDDTLFAVRLETHRLVEPAIERILESDGELFSVWRDDTHDYVRFERFFSSREDACLYAEQLPPRIEALTGGESCLVSVVPIPREDWSESWKAFFHVERVSERLVIKPSWEDYSPSAGELVIELDPGMSFGTGQHATTKACLRFIDRVSRERPHATFLDLGCGSGILSIAAARIGLKTITAVDIDPEAVRIARQNCESNAVSDRVRCVVGDLASWRPTQTYDIVAVNILAGVLCRFASVIVDCVAPGGSLFLAGIMREQYPGVKARFENTGFKEVDFLAEEEWQSGLFEDAREAPNCNERK